MNSWLLVGFSLIGLVILFGLGWWGDGPPWKRWK
jgi:hypothetical protein